MRSIPCSIPGSALGGRRHMRSATPALHYVRRNISLAVGILLLLALALFVGIGHLVVDTGKSRPLSAPAVRPPSAEHPFGTDRQRRHLLASMGDGNPPTLLMRIIRAFICVCSWSLEGFGSGCV